MSLQVVKKDSAGSSMRFNVTVQGSSRDEVLSKMAESVAKQAAADAGFQVRGIYRQPMVIPVNSNGECSEAIIKGAETATAWQAEYYFAAGL